MDASDELQALWTTVFGEPPFIRAEAGMIIEVLVGSLPLAPPYQAGVRPADDAGKAAFTGVLRPAMGTTCVS